MTEYTLDQMIEKFRRNPNLKFQFVRNENYTVGKGDIVHLSEDGFIVNQSNVSILSKFTLCSKFRLVNEPVSIKEALRAFEIGKTIVCKYKDRNREYISAGLGGEPVLIDDVGAPVSVQELLYGKWFIEGDD